MIWEIRTSETWYIPDRFGTHAEVIRWRRDIVNWTIYSLEEWIKNGCGQLPEKTESAGM